MGLARFIPKNSIYIPTVNRFTATFNNPTPGVYDFGIAANERQTATPLKPNMVYWLDRISFSATLDEGDYLESINVQPTLVLNRKQDRTRIFARPFPLVNYRDGQEVHTAIENKKGEEEITATVTGSLVQIPSTIGTVTITAQISLDLYEIHDQNWLNAWWDATRPSIGDSLVERM